MIRIPCLVASSLQQGVHAMRSWTLSRLSYAGYTSSDNGKNKKDTTKSFPARKETDIEADDDSDYKIKYDSEAEDNSDIYKKMKATYAEIQSAVDAKNGFVGDLSSAFPIHAASATTSTSTAAAAAATTMAKMKSTGGGSSSYRPNATGAYTIGSTYSPYAMLKKMELEQRKQPDRPFSIKKKNSYLDIFREFDYHLHFCHKNTFLLSQFISPAGKILPKTVTTLSSKSQRHVAKCIRRARHMGLLPYLSRRGFIPPQQA